jgi:hypothetical protein
VEDIVLKESLKVEDIVPSVVADTVLEEDIDQAEEEEDNG